MASFLGKLTEGPTRTLLFLGQSNVVIQCSSNESGYVVQAFKRLVLSEANLKKGVPLEQLQTILSTFNASLDISTSAPDEDWVRKLEPLDGRKRGIVETALKKVEKDLEKEEDEYHDWKGVRDLAEAHYNLKKRQEEIADLNQKLYHNSLEPQFIYNPGHPLRRGVSAWQTNDRTHFRELKDQAKERASAVRLRIDFTRRQRIKDLKDKRKDLLEELEIEKKREQSYEKTIASVVDSSTAVSLIITVRSEAIRVQGRKSAVIAAVETQVIEAAGRLKRIVKEQLGLDFQDWPENTSPYGRPESPKSLAPAEAVERQLAEMVAKVIGRIPPRGKLPEIRFPGFEAGRRLAYLGLALRDDLSRTTLPILYDLDEQGPRHTAVVGGSGSGKSVAASLIVEGAATNGIPTIVFDPTGSWTGLAERCTSKSLMDAYAQFGLEPSQARGFDLKVAAPEKARYEPEILTEALNGSGISVFTSDTMTSAQEAEFAAALLNDLLERMKTWPESKALKLLIVLEEAHRYLGEKALEPILEVFARTARARGVGLLIVSQVAVDLPPAIRSNAASKFQLLTQYSGDLSRAAQTFGSEYRKIIPRFSKGIGAIHYPEFGNALVAFRPPLHSTAGLSPSSFSFFQSARELQRTAATLTRHVATGDTAATPLNSEAPKASEPRQQAETTKRDSQAATDVATDWRHIAMRYAGKAVPASAIENALRHAGIDPPSLRTIQRFLKQTTAI